MSFVQDASGVRLTTAAEAARLAADEAPSRGVAWQSSIGVQGRGSGAEGREDGGGGPEALRDPA
jgi:hypothetical protein